MFCFRLTVSLFACAIALFPCLECKAQQAGTAIQIYRTNADATTQLKRVADLQWTLEQHSPDAQTIRINDAVSFQTMDGFGHALTGGSAQLLMRMSPAARHALLTELFGDSANDIHTSYIRVTVGASDMNDHVYTYDDLPSGQTDPKLTKFSLAEDEKYVLPVLHEILAIQPNLHILASPWTAPAWMKTNQSFKGGSLKPEWYETYAQYWVHYLQSMAAQGIHIEALTPQNEPENPANTPSMVMTASEEAMFIGRYLGPALHVAGITTRIIAFDHNCDHPIYAETVFADPIAARFTDGAGFHLYYGTIDAMTEVHNKFPQKNLYFTEQAVEPQENPSDVSIAEPVARLMIDAPNNWARNVLLWNLAADPHAGPHTNSGGCPSCYGALTLDGDNVKRLPAYYVAAHASRFVPPGSVRIDAGKENGAVPHVAYRTPAGGHVLLLANPGKTNQLVRLQIKGKQTEATIKAGDVETWVW